MKREGSTIGRKPRANGERRTIFALVSLGVGTALSLALVEGTLRSLRPTPRILFPVGTTDFQRAPKARWYGWAHVPGSRVEVIDPDTGRSFVQPINSEGWHDVEHTLRKPAGRVRILVVGDSFTQGYVPLQDLYTRQLEEMLLATEMDVEVISMGEGGFSTDQELETLRREGLHYQPDWVVLQYYPNDDDGNFQPFRDDAKRRIPPGRPPNFRWPSEHKLFRYDLLGSQLEKRDFLETSARNPAWLYAVNRGLAWAQRHSALVYQLVMGTGALGWTWLYRYDSILDRRALPERDPQPATEKLVGLIELIRDECRAQGARLVVFALDMAEPTAQLLSSSAAGHFRVMKPRQTYARYRTNAHTNAAGNRQMADDLSRFMIEAMADVSGSSPADRRAMAGDD